MKWFPYLTFLLLLISSCQRVDDTVDEKANQMPQLGIISMDITGNDASKKLFREGLLLLHNFAYSDAIEKFEAAQEADSTCAMAYWGEVMAQNKPLWRAQEQDEANYIFSKLGKTPADQLEHFKTPLEKDLCKAAHILFKFGVEKPERDAAYSKYMETLYKKYPGQHEVAAFYALSLLGAKSGKRDEGDYLKSAKIVQGIINENPRHPGALHYMIHSYDDPENAPKALFAANNYAEVASDAAHALHMPSHIFVAMGMWDEVISSNIASFESSRNRMIAKELTNNALGYHSFKWLNYGYLQKGDYTKSQQLLKQMQQYAEEEPTNKSLGHLIYMKGAYMLETNDWNDELILDTLDYSDLPIQTTGAHALLMGSHALRKNDIPKFDEITTNLSLAIKEAKKEVAIGEPAMCSGSYSRDNPTQNNIDLTNAMLHILKAKHAVQRKELKTAEEHLLAAVELEEGASFMFGPPSTIKPSREVYGEFLLQQNKYAAAKEQFDKVLERAPNRLIPQEKLKIIGKTL